jgi:acyl-coenzyme A synthetase/AMP-(fatty) acid ligase
MDSNNVISNLRHMAWERAKGELRSMLHTFWNDHDRYEELMNEVEGMIHTVEHRGLHE